MPPSRYRLALLLTSSIALSAATIDNWPQFRGPGSQGLADDPNLPDRWSQAENVVWKTEIPGRGWSSPIVWGDRVFVTSVDSAQPKEKAKKGLYFGGERGAPTDEHRWLIDCLDFKTGKVLWEREAHKGVPSGSRHLKNSYASETPTTDGELLYAYFGNVGIFAYDMSGKLVWSRRFDSHRTLYGWGTAASPILHQGRLYLVNDNEDQSSLMALDKKTGKTIWELKREEKTNWATPFIWESGKRTEIITPGKNRVRSYDTDGKLLWEFGGMSSLTIPTPFTRFGLLYIASGYVGDKTRPVFVVKPGASGDISLKDGQLSNEFIAWHLPTGGPYNPSPIVYGDLYYTLYDRGFFTAHDARTGKEIYGKQRITEEVSGFTASPWASNGKLFALSEDGDTWIIQAGPEFKVLGKNSLDEFCMSSPAIARGSLFIRTETKLYRIAKK